jgi:hypothetical protein
MELRHLIQEYGKIKFAIFLLLKATKTLHATKHKKMKILREKKYRSPGDLAPKA